ncbi:fumarate reductase subunit C [Psychrobacter sp. FDAARGOS_221]|uniref:fumarate reductase subunit C n=1 Tax=Psychrobacter sp. FDAARGOS_221 TaxID=1975705 RepID=UPI000BB574DA|nr:fumarate reductase subunit C [Psychrobacter sp. FDAARGOS_221]PNK61016.1 fumarate reductase subunit C [Psychrobacter sp. FDAARGOS_221]
MARKPYIAKQSDNWYLQTPFYKKYMLRELTCIPVMLAALNFFWCIAALASSAEAWITWINFQRHPIVIVINLIALIAALFNSVEWFKAMPKAMPIQVGERFVEDKKMIAGSWIAFALISLIVFDVIFALI